MEKSEGEIKKEIDEYLNILPRCFVIPVHTGGIRGRSNPKQKGCPDRLVCYHGRFIGLEAKKRVGGRISPEQHEFKRRIELAGGLHYFVRSLDEVVNIFAEIARCKDL